jgi:hypothetical protein
MSKLVLENKTVVGATNSINLRAELDEVNKKNYKIDVPTRLADYP